MDSEWLTCTFMYPGYMACVLPVGLVAVPAICLSFCWFGSAALHVPRTCMYLGPMPSVHTPHLTCPRPALHCALILNLGCASHASCCQFV